MVEVSFPDPTRLRRDRAAGLAVGGLRRAAGLGGRRDRDRAARGRRRGGACSGCVSAASWWLPHSADRSSAPTPRGRLAPRAQQRPRSGAEGPWFQWHFDRFTPPPGSVRSARNDSASGFRRAPGDGIVIHPELDTTCWSCGSPTTCAAAATVTSGGSGCTGTTCGSTPRTTSTTPPAGCGGWFAGSSTGSPADSDRGIVVPRCDDGLCPLDRGRSAHLSALMRCSGSWRSWPVSAAPSTAASWRSWPRWDRDELWGPPAPGRWLALRPEAARLGGQCQDDRHRRATQRGLSRCVGALRQTRLSLIRSGSSPPAADGSDEHYAQLASVASVHQLRHPR